jgi:hypothetical protein
MAVAALVLPISGPYTGTWAGSPLGTQNDDGFVLTGAYQGQEVSGRDAYGMSLIEAIFRGINWRLRFTGLEWSRPGILAAMQAFGSFQAPTNTFTPTLTTVGQRFSAFAQPLVLNNILPVQAFGTGPGANPTFIAMLTAAGAVLAPQSNIQSMLTSKLREAPIEMVLLPYQATVGSLTVNTSFTTS